MSSLSLTPETRYRKAVRARQAANRALGISHSLTDRQEALRGVQSLYEEGFGIPALADTLGIHERYLGDVLRGRMTQVRGTTAHRLQSITRSMVLEKANDSFYVPAIGSRRRVEALMCLGWSQAQIDETAEALHGVRLHVNALYRSKSVRANRHRRMAEVYEQLALRPGPSAQVKNRSLARGYAPPLAWDDIDDPNEEPKV